MIWDNNENKSILNINWNDIKKFEKKGNKIIILNEKIEIEFLDIEFQLDFLKNMEENKKLIKELEILQIVKLLDRLRK